MPNNQSPDSAKVLAVMTATSALVTSQLDSLLDAVRSPSTSTQDVDTDKAIKSLRDQLETLSIDQGIDEISTVLKKVLQEDVIEHLRIEIEEEIKREIDGLVEKQVAEELERHIPKALRDRVDSQQQQLQAVQRELVNSESCRMNSLIKTRKQFNEPLHPIVNEECETSPLFPSTVTALTKLNDSDTETLVTYYGLEKSFGSKSADLNWFLRTCGVGYQYVNPRK